MTTTRAAEPVQAIPFADLPAEAWEQPSFQLKNPMQDHDWLTAAAEVYGRGEAFALVAGPAERPSGLAVLGSPDVGRLRLLGGIDVGESIEVLANGDATKEALARSMVGLRQHVDLGHYPTDPDFIAPLRRFARGRGLVVVRPISAGAFPRIDFDESWANVETRIGRNRRKNFRRKWNKAESSGPVEVRIISPEPDQIDPLLDRFIAVEAKSWKRRAGTSLSQDRRQAEFLRRFAHRIGAKGQLRLCFLEIGEVPAAALVAMVWANRFWAIKISYDETFKSISPGELLTFELIQHAVAEGLEGFEFCGKEAGWTQRWTETAQDIAALQYYPWNARGISMLAADAVLYALRKGLGRLKRRRREPSSSD